MKSTGNPAHELVDLIDEDNRVIGRARRSVVRRHNLLHRGVGILCLNSAGKIHVHRRTTTKDVFPGLHDMLVGGVVAHGENFEEAARREIAEELGIAGVEPEFICRHLYLGPQNRSLVAVYRVVWDGPIRLQEEEIAWGAYLTPEELERQLGEWTFVPDGLEIYERLRRERRLPPLASPG